MVVDRSQAAGDNLYLMKTLFYPGQLLYKAADRETAEAMKKEARRGLTRGVGESARSSTSLSRRSQERIPAVSSPGKRRRISSLHSRDREREKRRVRNPSQRLTSSGAQQLKESTPSRQDEADKSLGKGKDKSRAKKAPAKKKSRDSDSSSSSSDSGEGSSSDSSSSKDEAIGEDKILDMATKNSSAC
jgi:hypothetical protein